MERVLMNDEMVAAVTGMIVLLVYLVMFGILFAGYILSARGLSAIAKRRGIAKHWLAWIPVADSWIVGSIADEYDARMGIERKWRKVIITLSVIGFGGVFIGYGGFFGTIISASLRHAPAEPPVGEWVGSFIVFYLLVIVAAVVMMAAAFVKQICIFKIYESTVSEKAVKYLLLSLMVPLAGPICLFKCRYKGYELELPETEE